MSTKQQIITAGAFERQARHEYEMYFLGILHNAVNVVNLPGDIPKRYFLRTLFESGKIGYGNGLYLPVSGSGVDMYGEPTHYTFTAENNVSFTKPAKDCVILRINDQSYPVYPFLKLRARQLAEIDTSISQNMFACRTQAVYECADNASLLSLQNAYRARKLGADVIFATNAMINETKLTVHNTGAEYLCDKLYELRREVFDDTLTRLGFMTSNTDKRERVQSAEVNATIGTAYDNIYVMIDTFNHDAETGNLDIRLELNGAIRDYYKAVEQAAEEQGYDGNVN